MTVQEVADQFPAPDEADAGPYTVLVRLRAKPERATELECVLAAHIGRSRAEPGCITYHLSRDRTDPTVFYFFEAYASLEAFRTHVESSYISAMLQDLPAYLTVDPELTFLSMVSQFD